MSRKIRMTRAEFMALPEYSKTYPSIKFKGKRWREQDSTGRWIVCEYGETRVVDARGLFIDLAGVDKYDRALIHGVVGMMRLTADNHGNRPAIEFLPDKPPSKAFMDSVIRVIPAWIGYFHTLNTRHQFPIDIIVAAEQAAENPRRASHHFPHPGRSSPDANHEIPSTLPIASQTSINGR